MTTDDGLAALLAEHSSWSEVCDVNVGWHYECSCGMTLPTNEGHTEAWEDLAAHQAAVVRAAGWRKWPELEPVRTWYRSLYGNGRIWCESRDPDEVREASKKRKDCTFERYDTYEVTEGWQPWEA